MQAGAKLEREGTRHMHVTLSAAAAADTAVDVLVLAAGSEWKRGDLASLDSLAKGALCAEIQRQRFTGAEGDLAVFQTHGTLRCRHVLLIGVGDGPGPQAWLKMTETAMARARELSATSVALAIPKAYLSPTLLGTVAETVHLGSYTFQWLKSVAAIRPSPLERVLLLAPIAPVFRAALRRAEVCAAATCYARDLINLPAAIVTPTYLAGEARRIARKQALQVRIFDPRAIGRAGMGGLLGVAQGSAQPPRFIEIVYRPRAKARRCVALVGKGITFDSGGLSIKTADAMQTQKRDMAGGAAVLAVMSVLRDLALPVEVRGYVPATENMPGERALKPGDVVRAANGKTIEVLNTDAEGRLVLADALSYAAARKPDVLIDLATLTAAVRAALGHRYAAIMGTNPALVQALIAAGCDCGEHLWELPLVADYRSDIDSTVADIKNVGEGGAGTIIGGLFLREFVDQVPWAHIDFSSTVVTDKAFPAHPRGATGFGVRTLLRYLGTL
jgi:leucyl aminopeptidase